MNGDGRQAFGNERCENDERTFSSNSSFIVSEDFCTVLYSNVDILADYKKQELFSRIQEIKPSIIALNEILPKYCSSVPSVNEYDIPGFEKFVNDKPKRGCILYVEHELNAKPCDILNETDFEESVWCEFKSPNDENVLLGCIYRSGQSSKENRQKLFQLLKHDEIKKYHKVCIMGDFNFSSVNWNGQWTNEEDNEVIENIRDAFLIQKLSRTTKHRNGQQSTMPDLILVNENNLISNIDHRAPLGLSDHEVLIFQMYVAKTKLNQEDCFKYNLRKGNYNNLRQEGRETDWSTLDDMDVNSCWSHVRDWVQSGMDRHIPKVTVKKSVNTSKTKPKWMDRKNLRQIKKKYNAFKRYLETRSGIDYQRYIIERNLSKRMIKNAKRGYETKIAYQAKSNPKNFWKYVQEKMKINTSINALKTDSGQMAVTDSEKAETLNNFFSSVFTRENLDNLPQMTKSLNLEGISLSEIRVTPMVVEAKLKNLDPSKAQGPDKIPAKILKELCKELSIPFSILFNKSLEKGRIPDDWKTADVVAIFKKGSKQDPSNYRPVSLTCVICKVLESIVRDVIVTYFNDFKIFADCQHGFRSKRSCMTQLIQVMDDLTVLTDDRKAIDIVYLDFRKAFDSVPHKRLLIKLKNYGIHGSLLDWISDFLTDRRQRVRVGSTFSSDKPVLSGIPQGSILGPVLFTIFINDLPEVISNTCKIFADDTKIYGDSENHSSIQRDLNNVQDWSNKWNLYFNVQKCKVMHIGKKNPLKDYTMGESNEPIQKCSEEKDLGVIFDSNLSFDPHIQKAISKSNQMIGLIRRSFSFMDKNMFLKLYKALIRPHIEYGNVIWYPLLKRQSSSVEKVQRRATLILPECRNMTYNERLSYLGLPSLKARRVRGDLIQTYKIFHQVDDIAFNSLFHLTKSDITRGNAGKLFVNFSKTNLRKNSFANRVIGMWNSLPTNVKLSNTINNFKSLLDADANFKNIVYDFDD